MTRQPPAEPRNNRVTLRLSDAEYARAGAVQAVEGGDVADALRLLLRLGWDTWSATQQPPPRTAKARKGQP